MSKESSILSLFDLMYPDEDDISEPTSPPLLSPINYEDRGAEKREYSPPIIGLNTYDGSYMVGQLPTHQTNENDGVLPSAPTNGVDNEEAATSYPGPPWFRWHGGDGLLGYQVLHQGRDFQCPYLHYKVHHRVLFEVGMEGNGHQQFVREVFAHPRQPVAAPTVEDNDLEIFIQDIPFNFAVKQALDKLEDPGALAKVAQLRTLNACIPVFSE